MSDKLTVFTAGEINTVSLSDIGKLQADQSRSSGVHASLRK